MRSMQVIKIKGDIDNMCKKKLYPQEEENYF